MPDTVPGAEDTVVNKTNKLPTRMEIMLQVFFAQGNAYLYLTENPATSWKQCYYSERRSDILISCPL